MPDLFFADLVRETSTSTGTGAFVLDGATPGHRRFADAVPAATRFHYAIAGVTFESEWEVGEGEMAGGALVRLAVLAASGGDDGTDFSEGLKTVTLTVAADWFARRDDRQDHEHALEQIDGLADALAAKQPVGSYAAAAHTHDYLPRDSSGNWIIADGKLGIGVTDPRARLEVRGEQIAGFTTNSTGALFSGTGMQIYLGDANFHNAVYGNSAPGIGAIAGPFGVSGALGLFAFGGAEGSRSLIAVASQYGYSNRALGPGDDNLVALGRPGLRWSDIHAASGTITTSDARAKHWQGGMGEQEYAAGLELIGELGFFQWLASIEAKGADEARRHFGLRAQSAFAVLDRHGLDWRRYGWCCHDSWDDDDGAHERFGIRPDQLALFLIAVLARRLDQLEPGGSDAAR